MLEKDIEKRIVREAQAHGWITRKMVGLRGDPDRMFIKQGKVALIEVKRPGQSARKLQNHRISEWRKAGVPALVTSSPEEAANFLKGVA